MGVRKYVAATVGGLIVVFAGSLTVPRYQMICPSDARLCVRTDVRTGEVCGVLYDDILRRVDARPRYDEPIAYEGICVLP